MTLALGIHCNHDAAVSLCSEDGVLCSIAEERLCGIKHYAGFPRRALERVLQYAGVGSSDIDLVAFSSERVYYPQHATTTIVRLDGTCQHIDAEMRDAQARQIHSESAYPHLCWGAFTERHWSQHCAYLADLGLLRPQCPHFSVAHHRAHASAAFRLAACRPACVLTLDGVGDGVSGTVYQGCPDGRLNLMRSTPARHSLGALYQATTECLGFTPIDGEHKTMGLSAYYSGQCPEAGWVDVVRESDGALVSVVPWRWQRYKHPDPQVRWDNPLGSVIVPSVLEEHLRAKGREWLAAHIQANCTTAMTAYARSGMALANSRSLCCAGGLFLNVRANLALAEELGPDEFFVLPDAGDSGLACGAALEALFQVGCPFPTGGWYPYAGDSYEDTETRAARASLGSGSFEVLALTPERVARCLAQGSIVGSFLGRLEVGPRALGNRSVLADPRCIDVRERLRARKRSESFVPFAPSILSEDLHLFAATPLDCRFMTFAVRATDYARRTVPAIVHIDGTMRPQSVSADEHPWLWALLRAFRQLTGVGVLLNTSFNRHGDPIAGTPRYAIRALEAGFVDALAIGRDLIVRQSGTSPCSSCGS